MNLKITHSVIAVQARFESFCLHEIFKDGLHFNTALALSAVHFPQAFLQAECGFAVFGAGAEVAAVGLHQPGAGVVLQRHFDAFADDAGFEFGRGDGGGDFDAAEEVAPHPVCGWR